MCPLCEINAPLMTTLMSVIDKIFRLNSYSFYSSCHIINRTNRQLPVCTSHEICIQCWTATARQYGSSPLTVRIPVRMKAIKAISDRHKPKSSGVERGMRETNSNLKRKYFGHCHTIIFWIAALVLTFLFIFEVQIQNMRRKFKLLCEQYCVKVQACAEEKHV